MSSSRKRKLGIYSTPDEDQINEFIIHKRRSMEIQRRKAHTLIEEKRIFNDPVHGHMSIPILLFSIIDTPQFQRLRSIKQLGMCYFVFPGAVHNRFEHSIGVAFLAGKMCSALQKRQPELHITAKDKICVEIAGLCHDLGHGPFSHMFDGIFIPRLKPNCGWKHEQASVAMFSHLVEENNLMPLFESVGLNDTDITFIKELINGPLDDVDSTGWNYQGRPEEKGYLYQIVANKVTGIDVDKWDYFARDCYHLGISNNFDYSRFMKFARVLTVDGRYQICTRDKEVGTLYDMFHTRNSLQRRAYQHKTGKIIESMVCDALVLANDFITFPGKHNKPVTLADCINDMHAYTYLTDDVLKFIEVSTDDRLKEAKDLIQRIYKRDLYKIVGQTILPRKVKKDELNKIRNDIVQNIETMDVDPDDFLLHIITFDYGMKDENPIDKVRFYEKKSPNVPIRLKKNQVSQMLPEAFAEQHLRCYYRKSNTELFQLSKVAFQEWCDKMAFKRSSIENNPELTPVRNSSLPYEPSGPSDSD